MGGSREEGQGGKGRRIGLRWRDRYDVPWRVQTSEVHKLKSLHDEYVQLLPQPGMTV